MTWTPERISEVTRLWNEGLTTAEIGKQVGVSKNAVVGKAHRLGLPPRPSPIKRNPDSVKRAREVPKPVKVARPKVVNISGPGCRWPIGHPGESEFHFCSAPSLVGKPYCADHFAKAYIQSKPKVGANAA